MSDASSHPELLRSLGRLVRGLSALFWGLPLSLIVCVQTGRMEWLRPFGILPPLVTTGLLFYGLWQIGGFQKQERPWQNVLDLAKLIALINFGLSPFLYWSSRLPNNLFFAVAIQILTLTALLFLLFLNLVLKRLTAMLPDETLRHETRQFTTLNRNLLAMLLFLIAAHFTLSQIPHLPEALIHVIIWVERNALLLLVFLALLPLAMTMALIWKIKEIVLDGVFSSHH